MVAFTRQLEEGELCEVLKNRFEKDLIHTYIGTVLVLVNPFKLFPKLYSDATINEYKGCVDLPFLGLSTRTLFT